MTREIELYFEKGKAFEPCFKEINLFCNKYNFSHGEKNEITIFENDPYKDAIDTNNWRDYTKLENISFLKMGFTRKNFNILNNSKKIQYLVFHYFFCDKDKIKKIVASTASLFVNKNEDEIDKEYFEPSYTEYKLIKELHNKLGAIFTTCVDDEYSSFSEFDSYKDYLKIGGKAFIEELKDEDTGEIDQDYEEIEPYYVFSQKKDCEKLIPEFEQMIEEEKNNNNKI